MNQAGAGLMAGLVLLGSTGSGRAALVSAPHNLAAVWAASGAVEPPPPGSVAAKTRAALRLPSDMTRAVTAARAARARYGVPVSVTLGQAMLESGVDLDSGLARRDRNYFGIKCGGSGSPYAAGCTRLDTIECLPRCVRTAAGFRKYGSPEASFLDYGRLLSGSRYRAAHVHRRDPAAFVRAVAAAGYATDPAYAAKVIRVIDQQGLRRWDR